MKFKRISVIAVGLLTVLSLTGCFGTNGDTTTALEASGTISAESIKVSPEVGGVVSKVLVSEGQTVEEGDLLFTIDNEVYLAQKKQAEAGVDAAEATVEAAQAQLKSAQIQYDLALQSARQSEIGTRNSSWFTPELPEIDVPEWYFSKSDMITAMQTVVDDARDNYESRQAYLESVLADVGNEGFLTVEAQLASAQMAFQIATQALEMAKTAQSNEDLVAAAEEEHDAALAELENVQQDYNRLLTTATAQEILEARAQVALAKYMYEEAQDKLMFLMSGEDSLVVKSAEAGVKQAETAVAQAEANLVQAQAALALLELQVGKTEIYAPMSGIVLVLNLEAGELVGAGGVVMRLGNLDTVKLIVYVPEDRYGQIRLNQEVVVRVDSYPEKTYTGNVTYISDEAEYTPSNVQTTEGRKATVFAIEITISNSNYDLKPGMPADVTFIEN